MAWGNMVVNGEFYDNYCQVQVWLNSWMFALVELIVYTHSKLRNYQSELQRSRKVWQVKARCSDWSTKKELLRHGGFQMESCFFNGSRETMAV